MQPLLKNINPKLKSGLHYFLVLGVVFYLFSPLVDHWMGLERHARPHTHLPFSQFSSQTDRPFFGPEIEGDQHFAHDHDDHHLAGGHEYEEGFVCLLDIDAQFSITLNIYFSAASLENYAPLVFDLSPSELLVSSIFLSSLDPPPRF